MKITIDPMPKLLLLAEEKADAHFNAQSAQNVQKDQEYTLKRAVAQSVADAGETVAPITFVEEARLMGLSVTALAALILDKPNIVLERGLMRRTVILSLRAARTPDDLTAVMRRYGIEPIGT